MRRISAFESVTLDGVMQAPGRPDEDTRRRFTHGGWAVPYADEVIGGLAAEYQAGTDGLLLGRRTYEDFFGFWPSQADHPFTRILEETPKYVVSRSLHDPLPWKNSTRLPDVDAVARLKEGPGGDLVLLGSGELVQGLAGRGLIDQYILLIHPLVLGSGKRLFEPVSPRRASSWSTPGPPAPGDHRHVPPARRERSAGLTTAVGLGEWPTPWPAERLAGPPGRPPPGPRTCPDDCGRR